MSISASSTSRPIRRRRAVARNGLFETLAGPSDERARRWPRSSRSRPPTLSFAMSIMPCPQCALCREGRTRRLGLHCRSPGVDLGEILCVQEERQVGNDNCVSFNTVEAADPGEPAPRHTSSRHASRSANIHDGTPRHLSRPAMPRPLRSERSPRAKPKKPLKSARRPACGNVDNANGVAHSPTGEQKQKQRTFDVLPKPANLIRYRHCTNGRKVRRERTIASRNAVRCRSIQYSEKQQIRPASRAYVSGECGPRGFDGDAGSLGCGKTANAGGKPGVRRMSSVGRPPIARQASCTGFVQTRSRPRVGAPQPAAFAAVHSQSGERPRRRPRLASPSRVKPWPGSSAARRLRSASPPVHPTGTFRG